MNNDGEGKGPGYALIWGAVALLFGGMCTVAGVLGYWPWWGWIGADLAIGGVFAALMLTADWD